MVNTRLLSLIAQSDMCEEDAQEIVRIFEVLSDARKIDILENWSMMATKIKAHREKIEEEKNLLLLKTIGTIETGMEQIERKLRQAVIMSSVHTQE